jgi:hypothetical protein
MIPAMNIVAWGRSVRWVEQAFRLPQARVWFGIGQLIGQLTCSSDELFIVSNEMLRSRMGQNRA